jgi:hypothetical protein
MFMSAQNFLARFQILFKSSGKTCKSGKRVELRLRPEPGCWATPASFCELGRIT